MHIKLWMPNIKAVILMNPVQSFTYTEFCAHAFKMQITRVTW